MKTTGTQQPRGIPLALAVGVHLLVLLPTVLAPLLGFWQRQPQPLDIQTVSLFNVAEMTQQSPMDASDPGEPPPEPRELPEPAPEPAPEPTTDAVPIPPEEPVPAPSDEPDIITPDVPAKQVAAEPEPPPEPISTRPTRTRDDEERLRELRQSYELEARAREAQREAEAARRRADSMALEEIMANIHAQNRIEDRKNPQPESSAVSEQTGDGGTPGSEETDLDAATREYLARLTQHIQSYWSLPNLPTWDENLRAIIVITVTRDGTVQGSTFEEQAENTYFNQLVRKTIEDAQPMPSFPPALRQNEMEIGLRFRPGEVF